VYKTTLLERHHITPLLYLKWLSIDLSLKNAQSTQRLIHAISWQNDTHLGNTQMQNILIDMCVCVCVWVHSFWGNYYLRFNNLLPNYLLVYLWFSLATCDLWTNCCIYNVHMFSMEHVDDGYQLQCVEFFFWNNNKNELLLRVAFLFHISLINGSFSTNQISLVFNHVCFWIFRSKFGISGLIEPNNPYSCLFVEEFGWQIE
jgi:hypothetical protein